MAISDKLNYLIETKQLFKDRLNSLGAEIIESTTFRNYLNWLDTFYNQSSDKIDLSKNGVVGRTSQESTTGKNLLKVFSGGKITVNNTTITSNNNGTFILDGTPSATTYIETIYAFQNGTNRQSTPKIELDSSKQYTISINTKVSGIQFSIQKNNESNNINVNIANNSNTFTSSNGIYRGYLRIDENVTFNNEIIKLQLEEGSTATEYEPYTGGQPSPNPDYPQEINNLSGDVEYKVRGKNLFNKGNYIELNGTPNTSGTFTGGGANYNIVIPCQPNTTYTIQKRNDGNTNRFAFFCSETIPSDADSVQTSILNGTRNDTASEITITTAPTAKYLIAHYYRNLETALTKQQLLDSIQIEEGSQATSYEPYISESFPLSLKSRNLFDKDNANVISAYISASRKISEMAVDKLIYIPCKPNTTYSLQKMSQETANYNRFRLGTTTDMPALRMTVEDYFNAGDGSTLTNKTITTGANANYLVFYCYREDPLTTFEDMLSSIQIEEDSTATTYEPYYDIELCNISDYKDRIYSQNGEFYLEKKTVKVVLDGSETYSSFSNNRFRTPITISGGDGYRTTICICNLLKGSNQSELGTTQIENAVAINSAYAWIRITSSTTEQELKTLLQNTNAIVYYVLASSTTENITSENYPTLYSQLLAIQEFLTKYKINKEFLLDYSSLEIEY